MMLDYSNPLISVVTVCYNSGKTIETTLKSVLTQTYKNYEYWIIDGGSTDDTLEIVKSYEALMEGRLKYISEPDEGIYNAMNKGIFLASGALIGLLNSDDYYADNTLELVAKKYQEEQYPYIIINGDMERVSSTGELIYRYRFTERQIEEKSCFGHPSMFAAKKVYDLIGLYDETYKLAADGEWQYRAHDNEQVRYVLCHEVFNHMREGGASDNPKYWRKWFKERGRMKLAYNKGTKFSIYIEETMNAMRTFIKCIIPRKFVKKMYEVRYRRK